MPNDMRDRLIEIIQNSVTNVTGTEFCIGDTVFCLAPEYRGVTGVVIKKYNPTACEEQTMIECADGRLFHAPTRYFLKQRTL